MSKIKETSQKNHFSDQKKQKMIYYIQEFVDKIKTIEELLLNYLDQSQEQEINYQLLINQLDETNIPKNKSDFKSFIHLIVKVSNHHCRSSDFFQKINKILIKYQKEMTQYFTNYEIFDIIKSNKSILLYQFKNKTIRPNQSISNVICNKYNDKMYPNFFFPEIENYLNEKIKQEILSEKSQEFDIKRDIGENFNIICEFIRNDSVEDFISYVNYNNYSLINNINKSIFETNEFLIDKTPSLIEYAAFFGSIQIFRYLIFNKVEMTPSLWLYAIHGRNPEIIHLLEENKIEPNDPTYMECLLESIKCHHNEIANYIKDNLMNADVLIENEKNILMTNLKYYNFVDFHVSDIDNFADYFLYSCKYDYISIFEFMCKMIKYDPNSKIIFESKYKKREDFISSIAVRKGNIEILQILLSHFKVDINRKCIQKDFKYIDKEKYGFIYQTKIETTKERTPLIIAVEKEDIDIIKLLIKQPQIDINTTSMFQTYSYDYRTEEINLLEKSQKKHTEFKTALIIAIENNSYDIIQLLLSQKIKIDKKYIKMDSSYRGFYNDGSAEMHELYEEKEEKDLLIIAIEKGNIDVVQKLLFIHKIDPNSLFIKSIIFSGEEKNNEQKTALLVAIENENAEIIRLLLSHKDINVNATHASKIYILNSVLPQVNIIEDNALIKAVMKNNSTIVNLLLSKKDIDVNAKYVLKAPVVKYNAFGQCCSYNLCVQIEKTALFIAVELGNEKIVHSLLLKPETNTNSNLIQTQSIKNIDKYKYETKQTEYKSEFINAIEKGNPTIVKMFLQRNDINVNYVSKVLQYSYIYEIIKNQKFISEEYKKFEIKTELKTSVHIAVQNNNIEIIQLLLKKSKINVNSIYNCQKIQTYIKDKKEKIKRYKKRALHIAIENENFEIINLLLSMKKIDVNSKFIKNCDSYMEPIIKTPLLMALEKDNNELITILLSNKNVKITRELKKNKKIEDLKAQLKKAKNRKY